MSRDTIGHITHFWNTHNKTQLIDFSSQSKSASLNTLITSTASTMPGGGPLPRWAQIRRSHHSINNKRPRLKFHETTPRTWDDKEVQLRLSLLKQACHRLLGSQTPRLVS
ncbi:MAG: hypothetical protein AAGJ35_02425 [Myxococcota bacterium]